MLIYYASREETPVQIQDCIRAFKANVFDKFTGRYWLAGGVFRDWFLNKRISTDIDMFFRSDEERDFVFKQMKEQGGVVIFDSENASKVKVGKITFDLVKRGFLDLHETLVNFDFTIACAGLCKVYDEVAFYCHNNYFLDLATRRLIINKLPFPSSTLNRLQKYIKKGFTICPGELQKIIDAVRKESVLQTAGNVNTINKTFYPID